MQPNSAVLTENSAKQIFGNINVVGKTFLRDSTPFKVNALIQNVPENSHFNYLFDNRNETNIGELDPE